MLEVERIIESIKPDYVVLELCKSRSSILHTEHKETPSTGNSKNRYGILGTLIDNMYKNITKQLKITPGAEFRKAYQTGIKVGSKIILGDRPIEITLSRTLSALTWREKLKLFYYLITETASSFKITADEIEELKDNDLLSKYILEFSDLFPSLAITLIDERDQYLSYMLKKCPGNNVVAVVGKGHVPGIVKYWDQPNIDINNLLTVPSSTTSTSSLWTRRILFTTAILTLTWSIKRFFPFSTLKMSIRGLMPIK